MNMKRNRKWMWLGVVALLTLYAWTPWASALDVVPNVLANDQVVKGWLGFGDPNEGLVGAYVGWNDQDPTNLWAVGLRGQYDISPQIRGVLGTVFGVPETWWSTLDQMGARVYIFNEVGICNLHESAEAVATPGIGARLFVLTVEAGCDIFESGQIKAPSGDILAESGFTWFIGISRTFRF